jgi:hypothetical protein
MRSVPDLPQSEHGEYDSMGVPGGIDQIACGRPRPDKLLERALRCGWDVPEATKKLAVVKMTTILERAKSSRALIAATRTIDAMERTNQAAPASVLAALKVAEQLEHYNEEQHKCDERERIFGPGVRTEDQMHSRIFDRITENRIRLSDEIVSMFLHLKPDLDRKCLDHFAVRCAGELQPYDVKDWRKLNTGGVGIAKKRFFDLLGNRRKVNEFWLDAGLPEFLDEEVELTDETLSTEEIPDTPPVSNVEPPSLLEPTYANYLALKAAGDTAGAAALKKRRREIEEAVEEKLAEQYVWEEYDDETED